MYFKNRAEAGRLLADKLKKYQNQHCAVIALNPGAILVGAQIALRLHTSLMLLLNEKIVIPGELNPLAAMTSNTFTFNKMYSSGQIDEYTSDYHNLIEEQRLEKVHKLNRSMIDGGGEIDPDRLRHHVIILVSDGLQDGMSLEVAADYLKPIKMKKLVIVTPVASVAAVDRMHLIGDDIYCLSVTENLMDTNHYYDDNTLPNQKQIGTITTNIALTWQT